ncbi:MAG TPA: OmpH family outer membrane protein [Bacteroidales bacterium]
MKNRVNLIIIALFLAIPVVSFGQKVYKFGHINKQDIIQILPDRDSAIVKLQKYQKDLENQLDIMNVEYNTKLQKYLDDQKGPTPMDPLIKQSREKDLTTMQQNIQQFQETAQQGMQQKQTELMQPILEKIQKAISEVGKEGGFTYIFDLATQSVAYYSSDSQDVTDLVKQKLNITKSAGSTKTGGTKK